MKMKNALQAFSIIGLYGYKNIETKIKNNTLVLVGENGSGKTTFLRILFYFISGQWYALAQFKFDFVYAVVNNTEYKIAHDELIRMFKGIEPAMLSDLPPSLRRRIRELRDEGDYQKISVELEYAKTKFSGRNSDYFVHQINLFGEQTKYTKRYRFMIKKIKEDMESQILYLPTYRRIERELGSIFEGVDTDNFRRTRPNSRRPERGQSFIELVEFGMQDVQASVERKLEELKEFARESLNDLTLKYLGAVVNKEYEQVGLKDIAEIQEATISDVLGRIQDNILNKEHKNHLYDVINSSRSSSQRTEHDKIICHYFLKLLNFQESLQKIELQMTMFCDLCSNYFEDKEFVYDSANFSFSIVSKECQDNSRAIALSDLSSGEKQIVSLFSHMYLSEKQKFFVLIDEPELSLSVPWQKRFLVDILNGEYCNGLVAVTHSPFIYSNELSGHTHSLGEFISLSS